MRKLPRSFEDISYMISKVGISPIRGLLVWSFLAKKAQFPFYLKT